MSRHRARQEAFEPPPPQEGGAPAGAAQAPPPMAGKPRLEPRNTQACFMPKPCEPQEAEIYTRLLAIHCDRKNEPGHESSGGCRGALTIRRGSITLSCPLCGDARKTIQGEPS